MHSAFEGKITLLALGFSDFGSEVFKKWREPFVSMHGDEPRVPVRTPVAAASSLALRYTYTHCARRCACYAKRACEACLALV